MSIKSRKKNPRTKREYMQGTLRIISDHVDEKLEHASLILEMLNKRGFKTLLRKSLKGIEELKDDLKTLEREVLKRTWKGGDEKNEQRANAKRTSEG